VDDQLTELLAELYSSGREFDEGKADRLQRLRNVEPDTAALLALLVRATGARRVLELGTSSGYSTLWLAAAARSAGGVVVSVDTDAQRSAMAAHNLQRGGLRDLVELRVEDAALTLRSSADGVWDMVFLDAERSAYLGYWQDLVRSLRPAGLLAVDNVLSHASELVQFRASVQADARVSEAMAPTRAGLVLVVREAAR
jgi:predicted O-methyltransferase YrrM